MMNDEESFKEDLKEILKKNFNSLDTDYMSFKEFYLMLEPDLIKLRKKYNFKEDPTGTNTIIILHKSTLEAKKRS